MQKSQCRFSKWLLQSDLLFADGIDEEKQYQYPGFSRPRLAEAFHGKPSVGEDESGRIGRTVRGRFGSM